jgi:chromosome segregation ATPase
MIDQYSKENMTLQERLQNFSGDTHNLKMEFENKISEIELLKSERSDYQKQIEEEKSKNRNLVNLIRDLEKKKSSSKLENECNYLREQVEVLSSKLQEIEGKYKKKLEKKDMIIKKLDEQLVLYEDKINS